MLIFAIQTSTERKELSLIFGKKIVFHHAWSERAKESKKILTLLVKGLGKTRKTLRDIDRIAVCTGPGSFSAVRIGVTIANALGFALGIPVIGVPLKKWTRNFESPAKSQMARPMYNLPPSITLSKKIVIR